MINSSHPFLYTAKNNMTKKTHKHSFGMRNASFWLNEKSDKNVCYINNEHIYASHITNHFFPNVHARAGVM